MGEKKVIYLKASEPALTIMLRKGPLYVTHGKPYHSSVITDAMKSKFTDKPEFPGHKIKEKAKTPEKGSKPKKPEAPDAADSASESKPTEEGTK